MTYKEDIKWFVVQIKPNSYNLANRNLERQGFETFLPKMSVTNRKNNKFVAKDVYVFPGYIFVSFDTKLVGWTSINNTYGVSRIISFSKKPAEISSNLILELKKRYYSHPLLSENENLQTGDRIKMYTGPFAEFFAKVESVDNNNPIWVLLEYAGKLKRLKLANGRTVKYSRV
jgi:transcriptional antiterminator RfaH